VALFYGALLLDEAVTPAAIGGLVLILGGVALASRPRRAAAAPAAATVTVPECVAAERAAAPR